MHGVTQRMGQPAPSEETAASVETSVRRSPPTVVSRSLRYLFEGHPAGAETWEVAPGILWARVPLPFRLNHVNVWLLRENDGWTVVDTGTASGPAREIWQVLLSGVLSGAPIVRIIATHGHTDHVGLAGWLQQISNGAPFHISLLEWLSARLRYEDSIAPVSPTAIRFLQAHGCEETLAESFSDDRNRTHAYLEPLPPQIQRMKEGTRLVFGGREWRAMACGGHAPEHISLWCEADRILIAGDQILSKISPMIGVNPHEPDADPLTEYLTSLERFRDLPADALVLPSHGLPFYGLHERAAELADHHELRLGQLERLMEKPQSAMRLAHGLFARAVADGHARHAFSETLAHAHHLVASGRATRLERDGNVVFAALRG